MKRQILKVVIFGSLCVSLGVFFLWALVRNNLYPEKADIKQAAHNWDEYVAAQKQDRKLAEKAMTHWKPGSVKIKLGYTKQGDNISYARSLVSTSTDTFEVIGTNSLVPLAKDSAHVYLGNKTVEEADPASFKLLTDHYAKDNDNVFYFFNIAQVKDHNYLLENADPNTFEIMDQHMQVARDVYNVYLKDKRISYLDATTFTILPNNLFKDSQGIYRLLPDQGFVLTDYNPSTFKIFTLDDDTNLYTLDKNGVYFNDKPVFNADPYTFTPIKTGPYYYEFARDKNFVYYLDKIIVEADPNTYTPLKTQPAEGCGFAAYGIDKTHVYFETKLIPEADPNTFAPLYQNFGRDANHVYWNGQQQPQFSPEEFKVECNNG